MVGQLEAGGCRQLAYDKKGTDNKNITSRDLPSDTSFRIIGFPMTWFYRLHKRPLVLMQVGDFIGAEPRWPPTLEEHHTESLCTVLIGHSLVKR